MNGSGKLDLTILTKELDHRWLPSILVKARSYFRELGYQRVTKHYYAKIRTNTKSAAFLSCSSRKSQKKKEEWKEHSVAFKYILIYTILSINML